MKTIFLICTMLSVSYAMKAQEVDSIYFHLYTDSLKKGTYNYINVDGKLRNGTWYPLTEKQLSFSASGGRFEGNSLFLDTGFPSDRIMIKAVLKADTAVAKTVTLYIKKKVEAEQLKSKEQILQEIDQPKRRKKGNYSG